MLSRKSPLDRRLQKIETELSGLQKGLESLPKQCSGTKPEMSVQARSHAVSEPERPSGSERARQCGHDERIADYLATRSGNARPLRHEKRVQRNKAVVLSAFVFFVFLWVVYRIVNL